MTTHTGSATASSSILITGGAGFVGSCLAVAFGERNLRQHVMAFGNLRRRGSELALPRLRQCGVEFVHGDVRSPEDLFDLVARQLDREDIWDGRVDNVGGGSKRSVSLRERTQLCRHVTQNDVRIGSTPETHPFDVRIDASDLTRVIHDLQRCPQRSPEQIVADTCDGIVADETTLRPMLVPDE